MDLSKIISIAGKPGLYQIINQSRGGVIVTSLDNGKKMAIGQTQRVSALGDISMYTVDGDMPLSEIMERAYKHTEGKPIAVELKHDDAVRDFFTEVVPEHDADRVYNSDIRKLIKWFNVLLEKGLLAPSEGEESAALDSITAEEVKPADEVPQQNAAQEAAAQENKAEPDAPEAAAPSKE